MPPVFSRLSARSRSASAWARFALGDGERRPRAVVRQPIVGVIEQRERLALRHPGPLVAQDALEARRHLGHQLHLRARLERAGEHERLVEVAGGDGRRPHGDPARGGRGRVGGGPLAAGGERKQYRGRDQQQGSCVQSMHGRPHSPACGAALSSSSTGWPVT